MNKSSAEVGRGRRHGQPNTRDQILAAARHRFLTDGYQATSMRSIAADAEVDTALGSYYFGSKQGVFGAAMALTANPAQVLAAALPGDLAGLPERVLRALAIPNRGYVVLFRPVIRVLNGMANVGTRLFGVEPRDELTTAHTAEELASIVSRSRIPLRA